MPIPPPNPTFLALIKVTPYTVWKFQDFFVAQIFHEINFVDSRSAKSAIFTHLEALNFDFDELHFLKAAT